MMTRVVQWPGVKQSTRPCPCCDGTDYVDTLHHDGLPPVICCGSCGMVFADTSMTQAECDTRYRERSKYAVGFEEWNERRYIEQARRIASLIPTETRGRKTTVLDVGCATGGLMRQLWVAGFVRVAGIDPSKECAVAAADHGVTTCGTLTDLSERAEQLERSYDVVILSHVLEHVIDVKAAVRSIIQLGDAVHIEVPDASRYWVDEVSPWQQFNVEHVNHFDLPHLLALFQRHGMTPVACGQSTCDPYKFPTCWAHFVKIGPLRDSIAMYCDKSATLMAKIEEKVKGIEGPVICWGIGALARRLEPLLGRCRVDAGVDNVVQGKFCGADIYPPAVLLTECEAASDPILVTTILHRDSVLTDIKRLGLKNEVITL